MARSRTLAEPSAPTPERGAFGHLTGTFSPFSSTSPPCPLYALIAVSRPPSRNIFPPVPGRRRGIPRRHSWRAEAS